MASRKRLHYNRAMMFARGTLKSSDFSVDAPRDRGSLEYGWLKGYEACMRDIRMRVNEPSLHDLLDFLKPMR